MKKLVVLVLMMLMLVGCSAKNDESANDGEKGVYLPKITEAEALEAAENILGIKTGDIDESTGFRYAWFVVEQPTEEDQYYELDLKWLVEGTHYSSVCTLVVDANTGEGTIK